MNVKSQRAGQRQSQLVRPLKWHGGKHYLAKKIVGLMPPHLHYIEPYFGGGAVLFTRDQSRDWYEGAADWTGAGCQRGSSEVINDINGELMNFWTVLGSESLFPQFLWRVEMTPFAEPIWKEAVATLSQDDKIDRAVKLFICYRQSRQGLAKDFATPSQNRTRRKMNEQVSSWLGAIEGLPAIHERLKAVVILCRPALDVISQQDGLKTLFYLDPPYLHETRVTTADYAYEMTRRDHAELLDLIKTCRGKVMLSGYPNDLYDQELSSWNIKDVKIDNKASGAKVKPKKTERLWMNF